MSLRWGRPRPCGGALRPIEQSAWAGSAEAGDAAEVGAAGALPRPGPAGSVHSSGGEGSVSRCFAVRTRARSFMPPRHEGRVSTAHAERQAHQLGPRPVVANRSSAGGFGGAWCASDGAAGSLRCGRGWRLGRRYDQGAPRRAVRDTVSRNATISKGWGKITVTCPASWWCRQSSWERIRAAFLSPRCSGRRRVGFPTGCRAASAG